MNTPMIETERLILRKFTEDDTEALLAICGDKKVNTFLPWYPLENIDDARRFLEERYLKIYEQPQGYAYAVCLKKDNIPIGYIGVDMGEAHDLGYGLRSEYWHRGIATEAAMAVTAQVQKDGVTFVTATNDQNNPRSGLVMQRVGLQYQYSYEEQWQPKNILVTFRMYQRNLDGNDERVYKKYWDTSAVHFFETEL